VGIGPRGVAETLHVNDQDGAVDRWLKPHHLPHLA
jgi:hypothetical protein